jgi:hypothetical protein
MWCGFLRAWFSRSHRVRMVNRERKRKPNPIQVSNKGKRGLCGEYNCWNEPIPPANKAKLVLFLMAVQWTNYRNEAYSIAV